ncbi:MAG TPA: hypothetical protein PLA01_07120 [Acetivibrio sp.]|nr:hypothetical protein [Acetivibrio sp.]
MSRITCFPEYKSRIVGYFRIRTIEYKDVDANLLFNEFEKCSFAIPEFPPGNLDMWLHYQAHIFLMDKFKNSPDKFHLLYIELINKYGIFIKAAELEHFRAYYPEELFFNLDFPTDMLRTLVCKARYPHRILCYCFRYLLHGWSAIRIASELNDYELDDMLDLFLKEYKKESGLPSFFVDYMFSPLRRILNEVLANYLSRQGKTDTKFIEVIQPITNHRIGSTKLDNYFGVNELSQRSHMVSVWCNRIKNTLYSNYVAFLKN